MSSPSTETYIALGGNLGDARSTFRHALSRDLPEMQIEVLERSSAYRTRALTLDPSETQPDYWNAVIRAETALNPDALMKALIAVEDRHGRERHRRWAPRTLDLDLLLYGAEKRDDALVLPHPRLKQRAFVLVPLLELAPSLRLPDGTLARDALDRLGSAVEDEILERDPSFAQ